MFKNRSPGDSNSRFIERAFMGINSDLRQVDYSPQAISALENTFANQKENIFTRIYAAGNIAGVNRAAYDFLVSSFPRANLDSTETQQKIAILNAMEGVSGEEVNRLASSSLQSNSWKVNQAALRCILYQDDISHTLAEAMLKMPGESSQLRAVTVLRAFMGEKNSLADYCHARLNTSHRELKLLYAGALASISQPARVLLNEYLDNGTIQQRKIAATCLGTVGGLDHQTKIESLITDNQPLAIDASLALGQKSNKALTFLAKIACKEDSQFCSVAARALRNNLNPAVEQIITDYIEGRFPNFSKASVALNPSHTLFSRLSANQSWLEQAIFNGVVAQSMNYETQMKIYSTLANLTPAFAYPAALCLQASSFSEIKDLLINDLTGPIDNMRQFSALALRQKSQIHTWWESP